jgi:hypothetical protein
MGGLPAGVISERIPSPSAVGPYLGLGDQTHESLLTQRLKPQIWDHAATQEIDNAEEESAHAAAKRHLGNSLLSAD